MIFESDSKTKDTFKFFITQPEETIRAIRVAAGMCGYTQPFTYWFKVKSPVDRYFSNFFLPNLLMI